MPYLVQSFRFLSLSKVTNLQRSVVICSVCILCTICSVGAYDLLYRLKRTVFTDCIFLLGAFVKSSCVLKLNDFLLSIYTLLLRFPYVISYSEFIQLYSLTFYFCFSSFVVGSLFLTDFNLNPKFPVSSSY